MIHPLLSGQCDIKQLAENQPDCNGFHRRDADRNGNIFQIPAADKKNMEQRNEQDAGTINPMRGMAKAYRASRITVPKSLSLSKSSIKETFASELKQVCFGLNRFLDRLDQEDHQENDQNTQNDSGKN
ncbi:MAG: hypothetical protein LRY35_05050 [Clostridiales bacterium]|nr:hypothetical protein [Clostridiales bacterium]